MIVVVRFLFRVFSALVISAPFVAHAELVLTMGGDVNFNRSRQSPSADGAFTVNGLLSFESLVAGIKPLIDGDLNFANIETVVSDRVNLPRQEKAFNFVTHPNAVRTLVRAGFNLFSLANNHAYDYGYEGLSETVLNMRRFQQEFGSIQYAGIGRSRVEAAAPTLFSVNGMRIAFSAIGIIDPRFKPDGVRAGVLDFKNESDYALVLKSLREADADLRILSIHYGTEKQVQLDPGQRQRYQRAIDEGGVDLVIGHHPHVVRPIELHNGKVIIYSLGNFMMVGAASLNSRPPSHDYGLFARVYYDRSPSTGRLEIQAMEVVPLTDMSYKSRPMSPEKAAERVWKLNELGRSQVGDRAITFVPGRDGNGIACQPEAVLKRAWSPRAAKACANWKTPQPRQAIR